MPPLPQISSLPLFADFDDSDAEDNPAETRGGIPLFNMEPIDNNNISGDFDYKTYHTAGETAEPLAGMRERADSSSSDSSSGSDKTVVPTPRIGDKPALYKLSDTAVAPLDNMIPANNEVAHPAYGQLGLDSDMTVFPHGINDHGGDTPFGYSVETHAGDTLSGHTVEPYDATPVCHTSIEREHSIHEDQNKYLDGMDHARTSFGEHRLEYLVHEDDNDIAARGHHDRSSSIADGFETGLRRLSLEYDGSDTSDSLKYISPHVAPIADRTHQRNVSQKSSYPSVPSPLGPQDFTDDLASDVSGLVPRVSSTTTPRPSRARQISQPKLKRQSLPMSTSPMSLSEQLNMLKPSVFDSHQRRQYTDPFIDQEGAAKTGSPGLNYSPIPAQAQRPPPSATLTQEQKIALRQAWIADGAREIAALARRCSALDQQYQRTGSLFDLQALQEATKAFSKATDLGTRVEQRRNLLLPAGMRAMRTTAENQPQDGFGGSELAGSRGGEGRLLGGEMAVMERIGGEVLRGAEGRRQRRGGA